MKFVITRIVGYILGFIMFYAPFAVFQRTIHYLINGEWIPMSIHSVCFRIPVEHLLDGKIFKYPLSYVLCTFILLATALIFGPIFCGRVCPAGAFSEVIGMILPERFKIDWAKYTTIGPIRYGMLFGYMLLPFVGGAAACAFCNYYLFDLLVNYVSWGYIVSFSSSMLFTMLLWLVVFGLFTKGGRGFCNFLCPVGALLNLLHRIGKYLPYTFGMRINKDACIGCGGCARVCPMRAVKIENGVATICPDNCICCGVCANSCPNMGISYGRNKS